MRSSWWWSGTVKLLTETVWHQKYKTIPILHSAQQELAQITTCTNCHNIAHHYTVYQMNKHEVRPQEIQCKSAHTIAHIDALVTCLISNDSIKITGSATSYYHLIGGGGTYILNQLATQHTRIKCKNFHHHYTQHPLTALASPACSFSSSLCIILIVNKLNVSYVNKQTDCKWQLHVIHLVYTSTWAMRHIQCLY